MPRYEPLDWYENALYYDIVFDADPTYGLLEPTGPLFAG